MTASFLTESKNFLSQEDAFFHKASSAYVKGKILSQEESDFLAQSLLDCKISSPSQYLAFLKKGLSFIFLERNGDGFFSHPSKKEIIRKICTNGYFRNCPLIEVFQDVIFFLLKGQLPHHLPKIFTKGGVAVESLSVEKNRSLPDLERNALLAIMCFLLGRMIPNEEWLNGSVQIATWCLKLLDQNFSPFVSLWKEGIDYKEKDLLTTLYLLFDGVGSYCAQDLMEIAKERCQEKMAMAKDALSLPYFYHLLGQEIDRWKAGKNSQCSEKEKNEKVWFDSDALLIRYAGAHFDSALTFLGYHSSLGAIHTGDVQILAMGPQVFPLGDLSRFGIVRFPPAKSLLGELEWKKIENGYSVRGCAALASLHEEELWIEVKNTVEQEKFSLSIQLHGEFQERIAFAFFVRAKSCVIDGQKEMSFNTFQRYQGAVRKVSFKEKSTTLEIRAQNLSCMHLIPLGEAQDFWHSHFLLAYEISPQKGISSFVIGRG